MTNDPVLASMMPCPHRGQPNGSTSCTGCGRADEVRAIYACSLFERCTLVRCSPDIPNNCHTCPTRHKD